MALAAHMVSQTVTSSAPGALTFNIPPACSKSRDSLPGVVE